MPKVMLVEDDPNMFSLLCMLLEFEGYQVVFWDGKGNLEAILETMRLERPALVFLDVHLNQMNGLDLLRQVRDDPDLESTRILMASGMDLNYKCRQEGADGFILKPFMPDELVGEIKQMLESEL